MSRLLSTYTLLSSNNDELFDTSVNGEQGSAYNGGSANPGPGPGSDTTVILQDDTQSPERRQDVNQSTLHEETNALALSDINNPPRQMQILTAQDILTLSYIKDPMNTPLPFQDLKIALQDNVNRDTSISYINSYLPKLEADLDQAIHNLYTNDLLLDHTHLILQEMGTMPNDLDILYPFFTLH
ncbi:MAG: hypothetical protein EOP34_01725 [Rickettsiales bacterium]|nr:MAG: hypothetical protein EOP34_01725 [Rickettsiales bacterium]